MSGAGTALFLACAIGALLSALGTVLVKSPIRAAMSLLVHIIMLSGLFLTLHAHLLAALQLLVYAGAVVVLFVFVIMMIGPGVTDTPTTRGLVSKTAATALMAILTCALAAAVGGAAPVRTLVEGCGDGAGSDCADFGSVVAFSRELYMQDLVPFELISVLLTVAIVGAIAVARGRSVEEAAAIKSRAQARAAAEAGGPSAESAELAGAGGE
jgi:NADH-quinone oxidoreductase subunit J